MEIKHPDVKVKLTGTDGNVFALCSRVVRALRKAGHLDTANGLADELNRCQSYDEAIQLFMKTVDVS